MTDQPRSFGRTESDQPTPEFDPRARVTEPKVIPPRIPENIILGSE